MCPAPVDGCQDRLKALPIRAVVLTPKTPGNYAGAHIVRSPGVAGLVGGGVKIHPDPRYCNLYHWLLARDRRREAVEQPADDDLPF